MSEIEVDHRRGGSAPWLRADPLGMARTMEAFPHRRCYAEWSRKYWRLCNSTCPPSGADCDASPKWGILERAAAERTRQDQIWGVQHHPVFGMLADQVPLDASNWIQRVCSLEHTAGRLGWKTILLEEVSEALEAARNNDREQYVEELIQVIAVATAMIEAAMVRADL